MPSAATFRVPAEWIRWLVWTGVALGAYWAVLTFIYIHAVSPINATDTFLYLRINGAKIFEGLIWAVIFLPTIIGPWQRPSQFGMTVLYLIGLVPTLILYGLSDQPRGVMYTILAGYLAACIGMWFPIRIPRIRLRVPPRTGLYIACAVTAFILAWYIALGPTTFNFDLLAIYHYRTQANEVFNYGPVAYMADWMPAVMLPYLLCYFLYRKQWMLFAFIFVLQMFCLVIYQEKEGFIPLVMLLLLYFLPPGRAAVIWLIAGFIVSNLACELIYDLSGNYIFLQLWPRRFFFIQQFLYFNYFDVFSKIGFVYYSDSFMHWFIHYPFPDMPAPMVSYYAMGSTIGNPNTGFFGAGYMELGKLGVVLNGFAAGLVLKLFDRVTPREIPMWFVATFAFLPLFSMLLAQNFVTSLLTGGMGMTLVMMLCTRLNAGADPAMQTGTQAAQV